MAEEQKRLAFLIDGDNVSPELIPRIMEKVLAYGKPIIRRVYGNALNSSWEPVTRKHAITRRSHPTVPNGKNATDIALVVDAMDILHDDKIDGFCIVSSDSDFSPLATRLTEAAKYVLVIGREKSPLRGRCDAFISLESLNGFVTPSAVKPPKRPRAVTEFYRLYAAYRSVADAEHPAEGFVELSKVRNRFVQLYNGFDPYTYKGKKYKTIKRAIEQMTKDHPNRIEFRETNLVMYLRMK